MREDEDPEPDYDPDQFDSIEDEPWPDLLEDDVREEEEPDELDFDLPFDRGGE